MKKTKLLSALTAVAVVATTMGTFAAWDTTETSKTTTLTYANPVVLSMSELTDVSASSLGGGINGKNSVDITVPVTIDGLTEADKSNYHIQLTASGYKNDVVTIAFHESNEGTAGLEISGGKDLSLDSTTYIAKVTVLDTANTADLQSDTLAIKATLVKNQTN